ncbi:hypothetical protein TanjilG_16239 [Lupinus angustifolius]|uniref:TIR domain-containing protein n=1 Tax=Lupinus angustifolius TaxID=3871 RepID=A0A1J7GKR2_LUPAN|nr:hypothetical protein TanjilG_16239 [Lupinus angustifolius]
MECNRNIGQLVIPIFYYVDPSDVRFQEGTFGEVFQRLSAKFSSMNNVVVEWKRALTHAAKLFGWDVRNFRNDSDVIMEIVDDILIKLDKTYLPITNFPVGVEAHVQNVVQLLEKETERACIVGILGMGGIGKTTIAKAIYNKLRRNFEDKSFLENVSEIWEKERGWSDLQENLLSDILKTRNIKIHSIEWGKTLIKERILGKRTLVVLDDVTNIEQLNALCTGKHELNAPGSVLIITTGNAHLLKVREVDYVYTINVMDVNQSLELFSWHAFKKRSPKIDFIELSRDVTIECGRLPLALEVLGSYFYKRTKEQWKNVLSKLERIPHMNALQLLKVSIDGLDDLMEKRIFLDICCFFIGMDSLCYKDICWL